MTRPNPNFGSLDQDPPAESNGHSFTQTAPILMIGRDPSLMSYKTAVLATANLAVDTALPTQAQTILQNGAGYEVVIFSHTLEADEVLQMERTLRARRPDTKLLLIVGPGSGPVAYELFDATMQGLDGPAALISKVRGLLNSPPG